MAHLTAAILLLALTAPALATFRRPECHTCFYSSQCQSFKCWGRKCTNGSFSSLLRCGFKPECSPCTSLFQCATKKCWGGKCVFDTTASKDKCFIKPSSSPRPSPSPSPSPRPKKPECAPCDSVAECQQSKCSGIPKKCNSGSKKSLRKCFLKECRPCRESGECSTGLCEKGKCIFDSSASRAKCFSKKECAPCSAASECASGKCSGIPKKCNDGTPRSLEKCFLKECKRCSQDGQCGSQTCRNKKCVKGSVGNSKRCFGKGRCKPCSSGDECKSGKCEGIPKKCVDGKQKTLDKCFLPECAPCINGLQCATQNCVQGKCVFDTEASRGKCLKKGECELCTASADCASGICDGHPKKCNKGTLESRKKCFLPECAGCLFAAQCSTRKCWGHKCVFDTSESKKKCFFPECARCSSSSQCSTGKCWGHKCVFDTQASMNKCFTPECGRCSSSFQCSTKKCWGFKCVFNTHASRVKCFHRSGSGGNGDDERDGDSSDDDSSDDDSSDGGDSSDDDSSDDDH